MKRPQRSNPAIWCVLASFFLWGTPVQAQVFFCMPEFTVGFVQDTQSGQHRIANFGTSDRFTIKFDEDFLNVQIGKYDYACVTPFTSSPHLINCTSIFFDGYAFLFNTKSGDYEFIKPSLFGHVNDGSDSSAYDIGRCETF